jgi:hypothetical protein
MLSLKVAEPPWRTLVACDNPAGEDPIPAIDPIYYAWTNVSDSTFGSDGTIRSIAWGGAAGNEKFVAVGRRRIAYWDGK